MKYLGQALQDKWVCEFFNFKREGFFLDVGAMDGFTSSNSYVLEKELEWKGICVECQDIHLGKLKKNRSCEIIEKAVWKANGMFSFNPHTSSISSTFYPGPPVETVTFEWIFSHYNIPNIIDYISLDIEGVEYDALTKFPFNTHQSILWTIEHNLYLKNDPTLKNQIKQIMLANDYIIAQENVSCADSNNGPFEDWYIHKNYVK